MMAAYYNEIDPGAAQWLRNLIAAGQIAPGDVDTRSITEVQPDDLRGYAQCHFFAGVGGWSHAARLAGWPDGRSLWSGSCPCQPFSVAGKGAGIDDVRHLWPDFFRLIQACRPDVVVGEQVAGAAGYGWLDGVAADLAGEGYASGAVDIPACSVDAPHIRQRLYWVARAMADTNGAGSAALGQNAAKVGGFSEAKRGAEHGAALLGRVDGAPVDVLADPEGFERGAGLRQGRSLSDGLDPANGDGIAIDVADSIGHGGRPDIARRGPEERTAAGWVDGTGVTLGDTERAGLEGQREHGDRPQGWENQGRSDTAADDAGGHIPNGSWWRGADWIVCHDGKARRVADASAPLLAHGVSGGVAVSRPLDLTVEGIAVEETRMISRIAAWKGFGNAIVPSVAAEVLSALMESEAV